MKLIPEATKAWRLLSVQVAGAAVLFGALPADQQASILAMIGIGPERTPALLGLVFIAARMVKQPEK